MAIQSEAKQEALKLDESMERILFAMSEDELSRQDVFILGDILARCYTIQDALMELAGQETNTPEKIQQIINDSAEIRKIIETELKLN